MKQTTIVIATLLILAGCYDDNYNKLYPQPATSTTTCDTNTTINYANDIEPIITANCYDPSAGTCHNAAGSGTSGYNYEIFSVLQTNALNGYILTDIN